MGVWQGVAMDSLNFHPGYPLKTLAEKTPINSLMAISGMDHPQGGQPVAIFYPLGHTMPYDYDKVAVG
jgi:hypothetical protein